MKTRQVLFALSTLAALAGCEGQPDNGPPPVVRTQETVNAQIEKIKNDPGMSPQAKEAAIQGIQRGLEAAQRATESAKRGQPPKRS